MATKGIISVREAFKMKAKVTNNADEYGYAKPLLIVEIGQRLNMEQVTAIKGKIGVYVNDAGWVVLVLDGCAETRAYGLMPNGGSMEQIDIDDLQRRIEDALTVKYTSPTKQ